MAWLAGCASRPPATLSSPELSSQPPPIGRYAVPGGVSRLTVIPLQLVAEGTGSRILALTADGVIRGAGGPVARIEGERIVAADGHELLRLDPDGRITVAGRAPGRLLPDGDIDGTRGLLHLGDDGVPVIRRPEGRVERGPVRVVGYEARARATASVLVVLALVLARPVAAAPPADAGS